MNRFSQDQARANFICRVAQQNIGNVIGAMWHEKTDLEVLERERWIDLVSELTANNIINDIGWFRDLVISSEFQSQGIGKKLVMDAIDIWEKQWYQNILLRIHLGWHNNDVPANIKAIRLYENLWFKLLKTTKISKDINQNELKMGYMWLKM